jgi:streptogramin lyase
VIDPSSTREVAAYGWDRQMTPYRIAFAAGAAWVTDATNDRVLRLEMTTGGLQVTEVAVGDQPTDIIATATGELWVRESRARTISSIDTAGRVVAERYQWDGSLLAADGDSVWTASVGRLIRLDPHRLAMGLSVAQGERINVDASAVVVDDHGIWVATRESAAGRRETRRRRREPQVREGFPGIGDGVAT